MTRSTAAARAQRAENEEARKKSLREQVQDILANPRVNDEELKNKLRYCQEAIDGKRSGSSVGLMTDRRRELMREAVVRFPS